MPHNEHKKKTLRKARRQNAINRARRSAVRKSVKEARATALAGKSTPESHAQAVKSIDKAASYGVFHPNKAARLKSRLARAAARAKAGAAK